MTNDSTHAHCGCDACAALHAEVTAGAEDIAMAERLCDHYRKKLLIRGWGGVISPIERAYMRAHRSEAQQAQAAALSVRAKSMGFATRLRATDGETGVGGSPTGVAADDRVWPDAEAPRPRERQGALAMAT